MKSKWYKRIAIVAGILLGIILIANFGLNIWLKNKLPEYLKKNTDYIVNYKTLDVDLGTGNIFATGISVNNKNPENRETIGLTGTIDTLKISRFGIYDAIFNKHISSNNLHLSNPNLTVILANPKDKNTGKKKNPVSFDNINISKGKITIFKPNQQKFLSVHHLNLSVENLQMTEESIENQMPIVFDKYDIRGENFYFRPSNLYAILAQNITTENGKMSIKKFQLIPLISPLQFVKYYPEKKNLFRLVADEMNFTDIILEKQKLSLANMTFQNPNLLIHTSNSKIQKKEKKASFELNLDDIVLKNAIVEIKKTNENPIFSGKNIEVKINKFAFDKETSQQKIPFNYADFSVSGKAISFFSDSQKFEISSLLMNQKNIDLKEITAISTLTNPQKSAMDFVGKRIQLQLNNWEFKNNKLNLDIENLEAENLNGTIKTASIPKQKKSDFSGIQFPVKVNNIIVKNSNITLNKGNQPLTFNDLNANFKTVEINSKNNQKLDFRIGNYSASTKNFVYKTKFYDLNAGLIKLNKTGIQINQFNMIPKVSRAQFIKMIPVEKDLYTLKAQQISMLGKWDLFSENKFIEASKVTIQSMNATIFRSKIPNDDPKIKPMYSELLRSIKFPMYIENLDLKNSVLEYEEDTKISDGPGKLVFSNFNLNAKNLNSGKMKGKPTAIPITINCLFYGVSPMIVKWNFDTANLADAFTISGNISSLPATRINSFVEPYLKIRTTGSIENLKFNFHGNKNGLDGSFNMKHKDLKVSILKSGGEKNKILSAVANVFVKSNSGIYPESVVVDDVSRDATKSFFNLFWRGIEEGLKKTLIGKNVEKTEESLKKTVKEVKTKSEKAKEKVQTVKAVVKEKVLEKPAEKKKENFFKRNFSENKH